MICNLNGHMGRGGDRVARRRAIFDHSVKRLGSLPGIAFMPEPDWGRGNCWLTCLTVDPAVAQEARQAGALRLRPADHEELVLHRRRHVLRPVPQLLLEPLPHLRVDLEQRVLAPGQEPQPRGLLGGHLPADLRADGPARPRHQHPPAVEIAPHRSRA